MTFSRAKSTGWVTGEQLTATQINAIDVNLTYAVDGYSGGTYAPSSPIVLTTGATRIQPGVGTIEYSAAAYPKLSSRTIARTHHIQPYGLADGLSGAVSTHSVNDWAWNNGLLVQNYVNATNVPWFQFPFIPAVPYGTLDDLVIKIQGAAAHTALPSTLPKFTLYKSVDGLIYSAVDNGTPATATDNSLTLPAFELSHIISITGIDETIDADSWTVYMIKFEGAAGTAAVAGNMLFHIRANYTVDTIYP